MNRATPIPDTIETRPGGIEYASCQQGCGRIFRAKDEHPLPWVHVATRRTRCEEGGN